MKSEAFWVEETHRHLQRSLRKLSLPHASGGFLFGLLFEPEDEDMLDCLRNTQKATLFITQILHNIL
jgi:hypothetical protein